MFLYKKVMAIFIYIWLCLLYNKKTLGYTALMGYHLCISFYYKKTLGYTALMGVPPRVQPMFTLQ